MNRLAMPSKPTGRTAAITALLLISLAACSPQATEPPAEEPPLAGATIGGPFTLTSEDGQPVSWSDFAGRYRIVYFGYAYCPDVCPTDVQRAMAGLKLFEAEHAELGAAIQPLFITIDPSRDTQAVVKEFTANFHPRLIGLTGTEAQIKAAADTFRVFYAKGAQSDGGGYLMDHSNITLLFGPEGEPLATLPTDLGAEAVAAELEKWVR